MARANREPDTAVGAGVTLPRMSTECPISLELRRYTEPQLVGWIEQLCADLEAARAEITQLNREGSATEMSELLRAVQHWQDRALDHAHALDQSRIDLEATRNEGERLKVALEQFKQSQRSGRIETERLIEECERLRAEVEAGRAELKRLREETAPGNAEVKKWRFFRPPGFTPVICTTDPSS
jgi:predicted nuclease with TOPRIM domain